MTTRKKKRDGGGSGGGFIKKVSSLFNLDSVKISTKLEAPSSQLHHLLLAPPIDPVFMQYPAIGSVFGSDWAIECAMIPWFIFNNFASQARLVGKLAKR